MLWQYFSKRKRKKSKVNPFLYLLQVNLSSLDVNVDCDNTTLIQPPRVAPYSNGSSLSSVNNTSQLIISDEESASGDVHSIGNNNTIKNINIINEQDRLCITEFLSSFPDVRFSTIQLRNCVVCFNGWFLASLRQVEHFSAEPLSLILLHKLG